MYWNLVFDDDYLTLTYEGKTVRVKVGGAYTKVTGSSDIVVAGKTYTPALSLL